MRNPARSFSLAVATVLLLSFGCGKASSGGTIRVALTRDDNVTGFSGYQFEFDEAVIAKELEKSPAKFPAPLPPDARKVMFIIGRIMGFIQPIPGKAGVLLTLDVNMNHDLTDDAPFEVPEAESAKNGAVMKTGPLLHVADAAYRMAALPDRLREEHRA